MGCNCGKKRSKLKADESVLAKRRGSFGVKIKKIWKSTDDKKVTIKKVDNK